MQKKIAIQRIQLKFLIDVAYEGTVQKYFQFILKLDGENMRHNMEGEQYNCCPYESSYLEA